MPESTAKTGGVEFRQVEASWCGSANTPHLRFDVIWPDGTPDRWCGGRAPQHIGPRMREQLRAAREKCVRDADASPANSKRAADLTEPELQTLADALYGRGRRKGAELEGPVREAVEAILAARATAAAERLGGALQEIGDEINDAFQVGAAYALGVLASLAEAAPGSTWTDVAYTLVTLPEEPSHA